MVMLCEPLRGQREQTVDVNVCVMYERNPGNEERIDGRLMSSP